MALVPLTIILAASEFLMSIFGPDFEPGANALPILAIGQFVNVVTGSVGFLLAMTGHEAALRTNVLLAAILTIFLSVLLIPEFGLLGAAIATAYGVAVQNLLGLWQVKRRLGFFTITWLV